jgi:hypothetical protein
MWGAIGQGDQMIGQGDQISPLFHEGAQDVQLINLSILPRWVAGFQAAEAKLVWGGSFWRRALGLVCGDGWPI